MPEVTILVSAGFLAVVCAVAIAGLLHDRLHHRPIPPCFWSDAEHRHAVIMSQYYRGFGPPD